MFHTEGGGGGDTFLRTTQPCVPEEGSIYGVTSKKTELFITTVVGTSEPNSILKTLVVLVRLWRIQTSTYTGDVPIDDMTVF
jgi:hypothetical protein